MHGVLYNLGYVTSLHVELGSKYMYFTVRMLIWNINEKYRFT